MKKSHPSKYILMVSIFYSIFALLSCTRQHTKTKITIQQGEKSNLIWLEAEKGKIESPMIIGKDQRTGGGQYVHQRAKKDIRTRRAGKRGNLFLSFTLPVRGRFTLWARVYYIDIDGNSFYCKMDDQEKTMLGNALLPLETWHWIKGDSWELELGEHTLQIQAREDGARLDQILLTTLPDYAVESMNLGINNISSETSEIIVKRKIQFQQDTARFMVTPPPDFTIGKTDLNVQFTLKDTNNRTITDSCSELDREYFIYTSKLPKGTYTLEAEIRDSTDQILSESSTAFWILPSLDKYRKRMLKEEFIITSLPTIEEWIYEIDEGIISGKTDVTQQSEQIYNAVEKLDKGKNPFEGITGWMTKAYISSIDHTRQPYLVHIPIGYDPQRKYPMAIYLHGVRRGARHFKYMLEKLARVNASSIKDMILVSVEGRGTQFYDHIAEEDLFSVMREVKKAYSVDQDRIYLWGQSMGGWGTYCLACKYPHIWAALAPSAGGAPELSLLENIIHIPIRIFHGKKDHLVPVSLAYSAYNTLKSLGADVDLTVYPDVGHQSDEVAVKNPEFWKWFTKHKLVKNPKRVVYGTHTLRHNKAYWVTIDAFQKYDTDSLTNVEAEILDRNTIQIKTSNVAKLTLHLNDTLVDLKKSLTIIINDKKQIIEADKNGQVVISLSPYPEKGLMKRHGLSGPYGDQFYDPFIIVYGTLSKAKQNKDAAHKFANWKSPWLTYDMTHLVKSDIDVTKKDIENCHLILIGMPDENRILKKIKNKLPAEITYDYIQLGLKRFEGSDLGIRMIYPNPLNFNKYVVIYCGSTDKALSAVPEWVSAVRRFKKQSEIVITDGSETPVYSAYFNAKWQL